MDYMELNLTFLVSVKGPGQVPGFSGFLSCLPFVLFQCSFVDHTSQRHDLTTNSRLTSICRNYILMNLAAIYCVSIYREHYFKMYIPTCPMNTTFTCSFLLRVSSTRGGFFLGIFFAISPSSCEKRNRK